MLSSAARKVWITQDQDLGVRVGADRLRWRPAADERTARRLRAGTFDPEPAAVGDRSRLHRGRDVDGSRIWVRIATDEAAAEWAALEQAIALAVVGDHGVVVPEVRHCRHREVWMDRSHWGRGTSPDPAVVDWFVESAIAASITDGVVLALGVPHVLNDGRLIVEDAGIAALLEPDERAGLVRVLRSIAALDIDGVVGELVGGAADPAQIAGAADRVTLALEVDWSAAGFGLCLQMLARTRAGSRPRTDPLSALADELLHRLDLLYAHPRGSVALGSRRALLDLLDAVGL